MLRSLNLTLFLSLVFLAACAGPRTHRLPHDAELALASPTDVTLYSLEPWARKEDATYFGYQILGTIPLSGAKAAVAKAEFRDAYMTWKDPGYWAGCFDPRVALRIVYRATVYDFLLCYQCGYLRVYKNGAFVVELGATGNPTRLNAILQAAGVPISTSG
ncbi:MAG: hypothetical protein J0I77_04440 [Rudaea sp.]|uniref:hypothetical protein n=1 Tax=unclassified Rudaea TaxID=2627037 RepID=UPI0010F8483B|nr:MULTISPECIES: hypothetical protein [unclassified Rudaea]MBN8884942.1 hypothetical protein [Rudaea sp.]MBR0344481.1 hypothetical protein [Rudaea sp.]